MSARLSSKGNERFDVIVIGSGPGGQKAAVQAAKIGKKVAIVERESALGGFCVHQGTLPSKSFRESIYRWSLSSRGTNALEPSRSKKRVELPDMARLLMRRNRVISAEAKVIYDQLTRNQVAIVHGSANFVSPHEIEVRSSKGKRVLLGDLIFVATGAVPVGQADLPVDAKYVFNSDTILRLKRVPKSLAVLGAGIIGCEYASMFATAGTKVFLLDKRKEILAQADREIVSVLKDRFVHHGMELVLGAEFRSAVIPKKVGGKVKLTLSNGRDLKVDAILLAQGRRGNTDGLGLEKIGVALDERGQVKVNSFYQTAVSHIYAVGDVIGPPALASTSMEQGRVASCHGLNLECPLAPILFPYGIYTIPEISMVGKTEEELKAEKAEYVAGKAKYKELARSQIVGDRWGLLKLLVERKTRKILGVHIIGSNAANLVHIGQAVMALNGTVDYLANAVFNYPTMAEGYKIAALHALNQIRGMKATMT